MSDDKEFISESKHEARSSIAEDAIRRDFGLDGDDPIDRGTLQTRLADHFEDLRNADWEARPHIEFQLEQSEFQDALESALDGEDARIENEHGSVHVEPDLDRGHIYLNITLPHSIEYELDDWDGVQTDPENTAGDDTEILEEYYPTGAIHIHKRRREKLVSLNYITLFRDMSADCRETADLMHEIVDGHDELVWGEEPELSQVDGTYGFHGTIYYRPSN